MAEKTVASEVILKDTAQWDSWLASICAMAGEAQIWELVDPSADEDDVPNLVEPEFPTSESVCGKESYEDLTPNEKEQLVVTRERYKRAIKKFDCQFEMYNALKRQILRTTHTNLHPFIFELSDPREMIITLKCQCGSSDTVKEIELEKAYKKLKVPPKGKANINAWLQSWETTYK